MQSKPEPRALEMISKMLGLDLFVVMSQGSGEDIGPHLADHLDYMIELEREGALFASGPLGNGEPGDGLTILRAESLEAAKAIIAADPLSQRTRRSFTVRPWKVNEGSLTLTVTLSDKGSTLS